MGNDPREGKEGKARVLEVWVYPVVLEKGVEMLPLESWVQAACDQEDLGGRGQAKEGG